MKVYNDDCLNVLKIMQDKTVDLVVTSPPYDNLRNYHNSLNWNFETFQQIAKELYRVLKQGGVVIWVVGDSTVNGSESGTSFKQALFFKDIGFNLHDTMIYRKINYMPLTHNRYEQEWEYMFCFSKGKPKTFNPIKIACKHAGAISKNSTYYKTSDDTLTKVAKQPCKETKIKGNIFEYFIGGSTEAKNIKHPAKFPLNLAVDMVSSWSSEADTVLDPFMGSGTVGVACKLLNRDFVGIEIVEEYFKTAEARINETVYKERNNENV